MIEINSRLAIPEEELWFTASRASGPGGQHVNKVNSRVTLHFDVARSPTLSDGQRARIRRHLATRINRDGVLLLRTQRHRSQAGNRRELLERFVDLLRESLRVRKSRRKTRVPRSVVERRLREKKRRAEIKRGRGSRDRDD